MTVPSLAFSSSVPSSSDIDVVVIGAGVVNGAVTLVASPGFDSVAAQLDAIGFGGGRDELVRLPRGGGEAPVAVIGMPAERDTDAFRYAAGSAIRQLAGFGRVAVAIAFDGDERSRSPPRGCGPRRIRVHHVSRVVGRRGEGACFGRHGRR